MEQYKYRDAVNSFREVVSLAPGWSAGQINLAIALLNDTGAEAEAAKQSGGGRAARSPGAQSDSGQSAGASANFDEALRLLDQVLGEAPDNVHALYCRGIILAYLGQAKEAHHAFQRVVELDPDDAEAWAKLGQTLPDPDRPNFPAGPKQAKQLIEIYRKALDRNPYLVVALFKLQEAYRWDGQRDKASEYMKQWEALNPDRTVTGPGDMLRQVYGEMGKYANIINPTQSVRSATEPAGRPPGFEPPSPLRVELPPGERWAARADFTGPLAPIARIHGIFGAPVVFLDADHDGKLDLLLPAAIKTSTAVRDALLLNQGDGQFVEASEKLGIPADRPSIGAAAGDFDADGRVDLILTRIGGNLLLRNTPERFEDVTKALGADPVAALSLGARWLDLDQDGDLDLYVINHVKMEESETIFSEDGKANAVGAVKNRAYRNDGVPAAIEGRPQGNWAPVAVAPADLPAKSGLSLKFTEWTSLGPESEALAGGDALHTGIAALDIDDDRDIDLVLSALGRPPMLVLNDRLGRFRLEPLKDLAESNVIGLLTMDVDGDGRADLVGIGPEIRSAVWRSVRKPSSSHPSGFGLEFWSTDARNWQSALVADLDLDGRFDLLGLSSGATGSGVPEFARNEGNRFTSDPLTLGPGSASRIAGIGQADLKANPLPELVLRHDGEPPRLATGLENGNRWLALDFAGRWKDGNDKGPMRSNVHGLGTKVMLGGPKLNVSYIHSTPESGLGQSVAPVVLGIGDSEDVALLRLKWPDGVIQCELNQAALQRLAVAENCRKTGSCPVLFTFNGERMVCIGDFLGGGGLGYLVAPGVYSQPDRDESMFIRGDQLSAVNGTYRLSVLEPMDEAAYLDRLVLKVIDSPPGVEVGLDERFAPGGNRPTGEVFAWSERINPVKASDLVGRDLTATLAAFDRDTASGFKRLARWIGYAEDHGIVLDFGDRLAERPPGERLVLCLAGWVEYPYSQTNYAAATAGVVLKPPVIERRKPDGSWELIEPDPGYPAGLPRRMAIELTGKLAAERCALRIRTNMECYWDEAFLAVRRRDPGIVVSQSPIRSAALRYRDYVREVSPDGKLPLIYDYDYVDPAPLERLPGLLTRYGDVLPLIRNDDDQLVTVGPGDELALEFDASEIPPLPPCWTRSYVLESTGYCKDADPATAESDAIGPLPWREMPPFPFKSPSTRPMDNEYKSYLETYQTRRVGR
jgi:tetratricopeptide (TPR) repeat protein